MEDRLWTQAYWGDLLYLIDTRNALEAFKVRGEEKKFNGEIYYKHKGITAMTYGTFAMLCIYKPDEWLWNEEASLIVCDELQSVIKWSKIKQEYNHVNLHEVALTELHKRIKVGAGIVAITATPTTIKRTFEREYVNMPLHGKLKHYRAEHRQNFKCLKEILRGQYPIYAVFYINLFLYSGQHYRTDYDLYQQGWSSS